MKCGLVICACAISCSALPVTAQTNASGQGATGLETIVVTAQKRSEDLETVPVAVTAIPAETIEDRTVINARDLVYLSPSLQRSAGNTDSSEGYSIRGVGTYSFSNALQQSVGIVIDGVPQAQSVLGRINMEDIDRVEVLRGPQGMLFGRNASAGLINVVTKSPQLGTYDGSLLAAYGNSATDFNSYIVEGVLNAPLGDSAAVRLNGFYHDREGLYENVFGGNRLNGLQEIGGRLKFLWGTGPLTVRLYGGYSHSGDPARVNSYISTPAGGGPLSAHDILLNTCGFVGQPGNTKVCLDGPNYSHIGNFDGLLDIEYTFNKFKFVSISNYTGGTFNVNADVDYTPLNLLNLTISQGRTDQYTQEFRLESPSDSRIEYLVGLYAEHVASKPSLYFDGYLSPALEAINLKLFSALDWHSYVWLNDYAAFGNTTFHFSDSVSFIAGGRVTHDSNSFNYVGLTPPNTGILPFPGFAQTSASGITETEANTNFSWRLGLQDEFTTAVMGYVTVARGYKGPGFDISAVVPGESSKVGPEIPMSYELGLKSVLFDRRLILNAAAFWSDFNGFQAQVADTSSTVIRYRTLNAGNLRTKGIELEFTGLPADHLLLSGGLTYADAKYTDFVGLPCYPGQTATEGCLPVPGFPGSTSASATGNSLQNSPRWVAIAAATYSVSLGSTTTGFIGGDYYWRSGAWFSALEQPGTYYGGYGVVGAQLGIKDAVKDDWKVWLSGRNLGDKRFPSLLGCGGDFAGTGLPNQFNCFAQYSPDAFRTVWLTGVLRF